MNPAQIRDYLKTFEPKRDRTIVIVDFANVEKWKHSLHWNVGIQELANLVKSSRTASATCAVFTTAQTMAKVSRVQQ